MKRLVTILFFAILSLYASGQYQIGLIPRVSPDRGLYQKVGNTAVDIKYGSPAVNDRNIWGDLVPYDVVWRAGANNATTIEFSNDVMIQDEKLPAGKYAFFVVPQEGDEWMVIFNKVAKQWGAFSYDESEDALEINVPVTRTEAIQENLEYSIEQDGFQHGQINLAWEYVTLSIDFDTDYTNQFIKEVESRAAKVDSNTKWVVYLQGAEHLEQLGIRKEVAKKWIDESESHAQHITAWNEQFYPQDYIKGHLYWTKAKIYAQSGDIAAAIKYAERMINIGEKPMFYNRKNRKGQIDKQLAKWKGK